MILTSFGNGITATLVHLLAKSTYLKDQQSIVGLFFFFFNRDTNWYPEVKIMLFYKKIYDDPSDDCF